ncbi:CDF family Co(II)/Ni(II) efflux transporter DmeF [Pseudomonas sp. ANT_J28]|uniref:CDF family Co(II)/Ni(II) efflux transporter DmeF n=1 Tax=Pseudomonas sp. ANT_J28 TaxID=2597352 RepID=UPI0011F3E127|nr:CDF family Co(II)/Ni(II) efflux transporter DmeF [Pseudomonas sp. ANT_J28]KAA0979550.1 CDF family Co(II)/Ni(II) efflux transporter DmeF [Pseudomonas sp. ANT_J28]
MNNLYDAPFNVGHDHVFLGVGHEKNERKTWAVIALCTATMLVEIIGGNLFGSLALVADGLHMSSHAVAMLIAALAYTYARKHANDRRFVFGTGKLGDLAGFTSAIILAMIALLIGYEAVSRFLSPVPIHFSEAIPIAVVGLAVNIASAWLLSDHGHDHVHSHGHSHGHAQGDDHDDHHEEMQRIVTSEGVFELSIFEEGIPPVFRLSREGSGSLLSAGDVTVTTIRQDGSRQVFNFMQKAGFLESTSEIPEPHGFKVAVALPSGEQIVEFAEHAHNVHGVDSRDHNMRAAYIHVIADAAVSVMAIVGLLLAQLFGWLWMDPLAGIVGALVIANWSYGLIRQTGVILVDASADTRVEGKIKTVIDEVGDKLADLHVWRLGPGHLGAVVSVITREPKRTSRFYHQHLAQFKGLSHLTVEVHPEAEV